MAVVMLLTDGSRVESLPPVWMVCGESVGDVEPVPHRFVDMAHWLLWLMLRGWLLPRTQSIETPLCSDHLGHWLWKRSLIFVFVTSVLSPVLAIRFVGSIAENWVASLCCVLSLVCIITSRVFFFRMIHCREIEEGSIELEGVHDAFCRELAALRTERIRVAIAEGKESLIVVKPAVEWLSNTKSDSH